MIKIIFASLAITVTVSAPSFAADPTGGRYDGTYVGSQTGAGSKCKSNDNIKTIVKDGKISWTNSDEQITSIEISANGTIEGRQKLAEISGKIEGSQMRMKLVGNKCMYNYVLTKNN